MEPVRGVGIGLFPRITQGHNIRKAKRLWDKIDACTATPLPDWPTLLPNAQLLGVLIAKLEVEPARRGPFFFFFFFFFHFGTVAALFKFQSAKRTMIPHPSLTAPFLPPPPLRPQRTMDPYKPCWCQSGKKWKWCHKNPYVYEKPLPLGQVLASIHVEFAKGYCSYPGAGTATCGERIIRAHTVQRATGLAAIAERGHVISAKSAFKDMVKNDGQLVPRKVGIHDASTFMGFCDRHDTTMFRAAEASTVALTQTTCFLLAFRALAFELFQKR